MKKWIGLLLCLVLSISMAACKQTEQIQNEPRDVIIEAERYDEIGTCGDSLQWTYEKATGALSVSGSGVMDDYTAEKPAYWDGLVLRTAKIEGAETVGKFAFYKNERLASVTIGEGVTSIGTSAFESCGALKSVTLPDSLTAIEDSAFEHCRSLSEITIPNGVQTIGYYAFYDCDGLTSVTLPESVEAIAGGTFHSCDSLTSVTIPAGVKSIGSKAFESCGNLTDIYYGGTQEQWNSIGGIAMDNVKLYSVTIHFNS